MEYKLEGFKKLPIESQLENALQTASIFNKENIELKKRVEELEKLCALGSVSQQRELLELLTEIANSKTIYSNTRHRLIAKKLLSSYSG